MTTKRPRNKIEIDFSEVEESYSKFIKETIKQANKLGVSVKLLKVRKVQYTDHGVDEVGFSNGYFCDEELELVVAADQPFDKWFRVFIHESSHMDQWHEGDPYWDTVDFCGIDSGSIMELWLNHHVELNREQQQKMIMPSVYVELDCERRALKKILKYKLPLSPTEYAKRANAYVWFYLVMPYTRKWYEIGEEPYNNQVILDYMPGHLNMNYEEVPQEIIDLYQENI